MISIENDILKKIKFYDLVDDFARKKLEEYRYLDEKNQIGIFILYYNNILSEKHINYFRL